MKESGKLLHKKEKNRIEMLLTDPDNFGGISQLDSKILQEPGFYCKIGRASCRERV